jgi:hypothetical protein
MVLETAAKTFEHQPVAAPSPTDTTFFHFDFHVAKQRELLRYSGVCRTWRAIARELILKRLVIPAFNGYRFDTTTFFSALDSIPHPGDLGLGWWTTRLDILVDLHDSSGTYLLLHNILDIRTIFPNVRHLFLGEWSAYPPPNGVLVTHSVLSQYQDTLTHLTWLGHLESFYDALIEIGGLPKLQVLKLELESAALPSDSSRILRFPTLRDLHLAGRMPNISGVRNLDLFEMPRLYCLSIHHPLSSTPSFLDGIPSVHASAIKHFVIDSWDQRIAYHILTSCPNVTTIEAVDPRERPKHPPLYRFMAHEYGLYERHKGLAELIFHPYWVHLPYTIVDIQEVADRDLFPSMKKVTFLVGERSEGFCIPIYAVHPLFSLWQQTRSTGIQVVDGEDGELLVPTGGTPCLTHEFSSLVH